MLKVWNLVGPNVKFNTGLYTLCGASQIMTAYMYITNTHEFILVCANSNFRNSGLLPPIWKRRDKWKYERNALLSVILCGCVCDLFLGE